jgi:large subunit ribosomal protein L10
MMPKIEQKQVLVDEIKAKLAKAASVVMVDARGLTVAQDTDLRKKLRQAGVDYKVYKNTMVWFAIQGTAFAGLDKFLAGPSAFAFSYDDPMTAARLISKELKDKKALEFKAGFIENTVYDAAGIQAVAEIPSREVLLARLLGSFKSPMASFARVVQAVADKEPAA